MLTDMKKNLMISIFGIILCSFLNAQQKATDLAGPYLGQKPPGMTPEIFAPGLISNDIESECCRAISPDGKEIFFVRISENGETLFRMAEEEKGWTKPEEALFTDVAFQYTPFISPKGDKMLFIAGKSRPRRGVKDSLPEIWMLNRVGDKWSEMHSLGTTIDGTQPYYVSIANDNTLYFSCMDRYGIYKSVLRDGKYLKAEKLIDETNSFERVSHPYVAPDESFIIVHARDEAGNNGLDLYISFQKADGTWTKSINMGNTINTPGNEVCPSMSSDGKYIFFGRWKEGELNHIHWVSAKIIEDLRPDSNKKQLLK
jgi:Tol biopolymer transport system component